MSTKARQLFLIDGWGFGHAKFVNSKSVKMHQKLFVCIFCRKYNFIKYKKTFLFFIKTKFLMLLMLNIEDNTI